MNNKYVAYINKLSSTKHNFYYNYNLLLCFLFVIYWFRAFGYKQKDFILDIVNKIKREDKEEEKKKRKRRKKEEKRR